MEKDEAAATKPPARGGAADKREQRLGAQLRANLQRRKALLRQRAQKSQDEPGRAVDDDRHGDS